MHSCGHRFSSRSSTLRSLPPTPVLLVSRPSCQPCWNALGHPSLPSAHTWLASFPASIFCPRNNQPGVKGRTVVECTAPSRPSTRTGPGPPVRRSSPGLKRKGRAGERRSPHGVEGQEGAEGPAPRPARGDPSPRASEGPLGESSFQPGGRREPL